MESQSNPIILFAYDILSFISCFNKYLYSNLPMFDVSVTLLFRTTDITSLVPVILKMKYTFSKYILIIVLVHGKGCFLIKRIFWAPTNILVNCAWAARVGSLPQKFKVHSVLNTRYLVRLSSARLQCKIWISICVYP